MALRDRRLPEDTEPAVGDRDGLGSIGRMRCEIFERDVTAHRREPIGEARTESAAVERRGPVGDDLAQRLREIGLLQDLAGARQPAARTEDAMAFLIEARAAVDESLREAVADGKAFLRVLDRGRERALETQPAVVRPSDRRTQRARPARSRRADRPWGSRPGMSRDRPISAPRPIRCTPALRACARRRRARRDRRRSRSGGAA